MSNPVVTLLASGRSSSIAVGRRTFTQVYDVTAGDTILDESSVLSVPGLPVLGQAHPAEPTAACCSVDPITNDGGWGWIVTCKFELPKLSPFLVAGVGSNDPASDDYVGGGFPDGAMDAWSTDDPTRKRWDFDLEYERREVERYALHEVDTNGNDIGLKDPNINTAGDRFGHQLVKEAVCIPVMVFSKDCVDSYSTIAMATAAQGSVNLTPIKIGRQTIPKYGAEMRSFRTRRAFWGQGGTPFWQVRAEIICHWLCFPDTAARIAVLQQGYRQYDSGTPAKLVPITNSSGLQVNSVSLLDSTGKVTTTPFYRTFLPSHTSEWRTLQLPNLI